MDGGSEVEPHRDGHLTHAADGPVILSESSRNIICVGSRTVFFYFLDIVYVQEYIYICMFFANLNYLVIFVLCKINVSVFLCLFLHVSI